jgi:hypothetical protein
METESNSSASFVALRKVTSLGTRLGLGYLHTIMPRIPAPTEVVLTSSKHSFRLFLTNAMMSIPTNCFEASYQSAREWITLRLL